MNSFSLSPLRSLANVFCIFISIRPLDGERSDAVICGGYAGRANEQGERGEKEGQGEKEVCMYAYCSHSLYLFLQMLIIISVHPFKGDRQMRETRKTKTEKEGYDVFLSPLSFSCAGAFVRSSIETVSSATEEECYKRYQNKYDRFSPSLRLQSTRKNRRNHRLFERIFVENLSSRRKTMPSG